MKLFALVAALVAPGLAAAATFSLEVLPQGTELQPGIPFTLTVRGQWPERFKASGLDYATALSQFTLHSLTIDQQIEEQTLLYRADLQVSVASEGLYVVPPLRMPLAASDGAAAVAQSRRLFLEVPKGAVSQAELRPNKPLQRLAWRLNWLWWTLASLVFFAGGAWLYWRWLGRAKRVIIDPYSEFHSALTALRNQYNVDAPLAKDAAFALSHIARQYFERRSCLPVLEMTGKELTLALARAHLPGPDRQPWQDLANCCQDLENVKYQPGGISDQSVAVWCARTARHVEQIETMLNLPQVETKP